MSQTASLATIVALALVACLLGTAFAADPDPSIDENPMSGSIYVGVTLGEDWDGFPVHLMPDYENTNSLEKLNVTLPLYVTWILDQSQGLVAEAVDPPQPITDFEWFYGFHDEFEVVTAVVENHSTYVQCANGDDLEAPTLNSFPLASNGNLHVEDVHGGRAFQTRILLRRILNPPTNTQGVVLLLGWSHPGTKRDINNTNQPYVPGSVWTRAHHVTIPPTLWTARYDNKIVEWTSADFGPASPRYVDSADLSAFANYWGSTGAVRWGFETGESPANSPTWPGDIANDGGSQHIINASDASQMASDLYKSCGLSKPTEDEEDVDVAMSWFGFNRTGRMIEINGGEIVPEYDLTDPIQKSIGLRDPDGYRKRQQHVAPVTWGAAKQKYR